jgi:signal transduction histidine kinase
LAIVKKIIEEHGGAIWIDTNRKVGAGFIIQLPACNSEQL